jgi:hypothetical protein
VSKVDNITGPPDLIICADDQAAIQQADEVTNGREIGLWDRARFVVRIKFKDKASRR